MCDVWAVQWQHSESIEWKNDNANQFYWCRASSDTFGTSIG